MPHKRERERDGQRERLIRQSSVRRRDRMQLAPSSVLCRGLLDSSPRFPLDSASGAMPPKNKRLRDEEESIHSLAALRGVNASNLADLLQRLGRPHSKQAIQREIGRTLEQVRGTVALPLQNGTTFRWPIANLSLLLPLALKECDGFATMFAEMMGIVGHARPWRLILYFDEVTPGNVISPDNRRKSYAFYVSFFELRRHLRLCEAWLCIAVLRHDVLREVQGGVPAACRGLLRTMLLGPSSLAEAGICITCPRSGRPVILQVELSRILGDDAAGTAMFGFKGASGLRPCNDCKNVIMKTRDDDVGLTSFKYNSERYLVDIGCCDREMFDPMSDEDIFRAHDILENLHGRCFKYQFEDLQKAMGLNFVAEGVLADKQLRPLVRPSMFARDPAHTCLCNGTAGWEISGLFMAYKKVRPQFAFSTMRELCGAGWEWPTWCRTKGLACKHVFSDAREDKAFGDGVLKAGGSEVLLVYPLVRYFVETIVAKQGLIPAERKSFLSLCDLLDRLQHIKHEGKERNDMTAVIEAASRHLRDHQAAYGDTLLKPKHHYEQHLDKHSDFYLDCFVQERKHTLLKDCAAPIRNTSAFEASLLASMLNSSFEEMKIVKLQGLAEPTTTSDELSATIGKPCRVSVSMRNEGVEIGMGDFAFIGPSTAISVEACTETDGKLHLIVRRLTRIARETPTTSHWRWEPGLHMFAADRPMQLAHCWFDTAAGHRVVLGLNMRD